MPDADPPLTHSPAPAANGGPAEALAICQVCREGVPPAAYEGHLQRAHGLYLYRGVHGSRADTIDLLLDDLLVLYPADPPWQALVRLARSENSDSAEQTIADILVPALTRLDRSLQVPISRALAALIAPGNQTFLQTLARRPEPAGRVVALLGLVDPPAPDRRALRLARELIADEAIDIDLRCQALAALLGRVDEPGQASEQLLKLARQMGKTRTLELIGHLESRLGPHPAVAEVQGQLEHRIRMSCPRCNMEMRQPQMLVHLWQEHRLLLDGLRVRDPWSVVEEWLDAARTSQDMDRIAQSRIAADNIDPKGGQKRLARMLLMRGLLDQTARQELLSEAAEQQGGCCPWCFEFVAVPRVETPLAVRWRATRLDAEAYSVNLEEGRIRPWLTIRTPGEILFDGVEPGRSLTPDGAAFITAGLIVLVANLFATFWPVHPPGGPLQPVVLLLLAAWLVHFLTRLGFRMPTLPRERLPGYAWTILVPRLHSGGFVLHDSAFVAGLASLGTEGVEEECLDEQVRKVGVALDRGEAPASHLAALLRLQIDLAAADEKDPIPLVVRQLSRCFTGKRPLALAQHLLEDWAANWWTRGNLARLRILLCDQAFEAGFEVSTLIEAGQNAPALGTVLGTEAPRSLAALRLLWSQRPTRPWERLGDLKTAFEVAGNPLYLDLLSAHPDLLLWQSFPEIELGNGGEAPTPATIFFTLPGLWVQSELFLIPPRVVEVRRRGPGTEMILGQVTFRSPGNLEPFSLQLERWFRWIFHDFLPQIDRVLTWPVPDRAALLRAWGAVPCPACGKHLIPRIGEVGTPAE